MAVTMGSADFAVGENRVVFLIVENDGSLVQSPRAKIRLGLEGGSAQTAEAVLERVGRTSASTGGARRAPRLHGGHGCVCGAPSTSAPGRYWLWSTLEGEGVQASGRWTSPDGRARGRGEGPPRTIRRWRTHRPVDHDGRIPPDTELLRYSWRDSLDAGVPFVVVFATPQFCVSRVCGPTVEVVQKAAQEFAG